MRVFLNHRRYEIWKKNFMGYFSRFDKLGHQINSKNKKIKFDHTSALSPAKNIKTTTLKTPVPFLCIASLKNPNFGLNLLRVQGTKRSRSLLISSITSSATYLWGIEVETSHILCITYATSLWTMPRSIVQARKLPAT